MLNDDNVMIEISEKQSPNGMKWSDFKVGKDISMKMEYWWNITEQAECKIAKIKALVIMIRPLSVIFSILAIQYHESYFRKTFASNLCARLNVRR